MLKTKRPRRTCGCGRALVWHRQSASWVCPEVDRIAPAATGMLKPTDSMVPALYIVGKSGMHVTCYPGELVDPDEEPTLRELAVRGVNTVERAKRNAEIGGRPVVVSARANETFECSDCGFRTPSVQRMMNHLMAVDHERAENPAGEVLNPGGHGRRPARSV